MKKLAIIFTCVFFASLIGFTVTASITGIRAVSGWDWLGIGWHIGGGTGEDVNSNFFDASMYDNVEIDIIAARVTVKISADETARVNYKSANSRVVFTAEVRNGTLLLKETGTYWRGGWWWGIGGGSIRQSTLDVELPAKVYDSVTLNTTSGRVNADIPETDELHLNTTSGDIKVNYRGGNTPSYLYSSSTSGTITVNDFAPERYNISSTSGKLFFNGLAGRGRVELTSGSATLDFAEWNGSLGIDIISGSVKVTVPKNSGANIRFDRVSGSIRYDLDGDSGNLSRSGSHRAGGGNVQDVDVDLISGNVSIRN